MRAANLALEFVLTMFETEPDFPRAALAARLSELASRGILVGTSSWKYEGWLGQLYEPERYFYRKRFARSRFEAGCLTEYAEVFRTVCVDAGFYQFPNERSVEKLYVQVPDSFRLGFKVTDEITIRRFPSLDRFGSRAGELNKNFLNAELFRTAFLGPLEPIREKVGVLMFEFSPFRGDDFEGDTDFIVALDGFLAQLPVGWQYGVEIRNRELLRTDYFDVLRRHGVAHVFNSWTRMPPTTEQMAATGSMTADFYAARFLLRPARTYEEAVEAFAPYRSVKDPYPEGREAIGALLTRSPKSRVRPSYLFVNNRLEGNALQTIAAALRILGEGPD